MNARPPELPRELDPWIDGELFEHAPLSIAIIDPSLRVLVANANFVAVFGQPNAKACYEVYKNRDRPCDSCAVLRTLKDGKSRISEEQGVDCIGSSAAYVVHHSPVQDAAGSVSCVVNMSYDVTERQDFLNRYNVIFDRAPCSLSVINKDYRIVRANLAVRNQFDHPIGAHCFEIYKQRTERCEECPALQTFEDGRPHTANQIRRSNDGSHTYHVVSTAPLSFGTRQTSHVVEMSLDVTEAHVLSERLLQESAFRRDVTETAIDALVAVDRPGTVTIYNAAAEGLFGLPATEVIGTAQADRFFPATFLRAMDAGESTVVLPETTVLAADGEAIPVRFSGTVLHQGDEIIGGAAFFQDLREIKKLEQRQLESARLAAVGQTVTQLAHSIKNILMGLQGGIYDIKTAAERSDPTRATDGLDTLERNYRRITALVRDFLRFSKEHEPELERSHPNDVATEIYELYRQVADRRGIELRFEPQPDMAPTWLDPRGIHTCLANLITNAFDACRAAEQRPCQVELRLGERHGAVVFEVQDTGGGMTPEVQQKIFRSLFTTKGLSGTGLGLVMTDKIVKDHGGRVTFESQPGRGSLFRIVLPRSGTSRGTGTPRRRATDPAASQEGDDG